MKHGLNDQEVLKSRQQFGSNITTEPKEKCIFSQFLEKFSDPIIIILLITLCLSFSISLYEIFFQNGTLSHLIEPFGILFAILLATGIGFWFEYSANNKFKILNQVNNDEKVKVFRNGFIYHISRKDIVVGDVVLIETGDEIPADGILIEANSLQVNESSLTGESLCNKTIIESEFQEESTYPSNYVLKSTTVLNGLGIFKVEHIGDQTEYGKVYQGANIDSSIKTPLTIQLDDLANNITKVSYGLAACILTFSLISYFFTETFHLLDFIRYFLNSIMIAVTIIVVAVPEGLPMSVVLSLALSMQRMLKMNNLVRKMHATETMGAVNVICTDKTGTLTENKMKVCDVYILDNIDKENLYIAISVNSTANINNNNVIGNPTEGSLLFYLQDNQINYQDIRKSYEIVKQIPFTTENKYMLTVVKHQDKFICYVKGAPEILLKHSKLSQETINNVQDVLYGYQEKANRTIAVALKVIDTLDDINIDGLTMLAVFGISDPIRVEIQQAISDCLSAGVDIKIITGDTSKTAIEIAKQIGMDIKDENHITGIDFFNTEDKDLDINKIKIISRARPLDKQRLVHLLQEQGNVVAVTGDGTNDAPALKAAQVGLSMGTGSFVAKQASDITILDDSFSSIDKAILWGRSLYQNIQRFILFQLTINFVACIIVLLGVLFGMKSPLTVVQMLWVNLIMDTFAALSLASLTPNPLVMQDKPRRLNESILSKQMKKQIITVGSCFVIILLILLQYFNNYDITSLTQFSFKDMISALFVFKNGIMTTYETSLFFTIFIMLQFWNLFNAKSFLTKKSSFYQIKDNIGFVLVALLILVGQILIVNYGGEVFHTTPISFFDWLIIFISTSLVLFIQEIRCYIKNKNSF